MRSINLTDILQDTDIDGKDLRIIKNIHWQQEASTKIDGEFSNFRPVRRRVRQGCVLSPDLFAICVEVILRLQRSESRRQNDKQLQIRRRHCVISDFKEGLQDLLNAITRHKEENDVVVS